PNSIFVLDAWYKSGLCYYRLNNMIRTREAFQSLLNKFPQSIYSNEARFSLAELSFTEQKFEDAASNYQLLLQQKDLPGQLAEKSLYGLAWADFKLSKYSEALELFLNFEQKYPNSTFREDVLFKKAECYRNLKMYDRARSSFSLFAERYPTSSLQAEALFQSGQAYYKQNDFKRAVKTFLDLAEQLDKAYLSTHEAGIGSAPSTVTPDTISAQPTTDNGVSLPFAADTLFKLKAKAIDQAGWSYYRQGDYQNAYLTYIKITDAKDQFPNDMVREATFRQGDCLYNLRRYREAISRYEKVLELPGASFVKEALYAMFLSNLEIENFAGAKNTWKQFSDLYPKDPLVMEMDEKLIEKQHQ
ncbi:MAG: tetratricopeptide repeat protein, partial [Candidatus Margulisiibacteriota bacterium]